VWGEFCGVLDPVGQRLAPYRVGRRPYFGNQYLAICVCVPFSGTYVLGSLTAWHGTVKIATVQDAVFVIPSMHAQPYG
jgi:hypothetical protein